ncbi:S8 family serine peptidase [Actinomadura sp. 21ATH]|uniref:S8 family peptidase n=1 Tax=Actinomadura sp. 21ATH TaxID=1735444 RepID=UPI0035C0E14E
MLDQEARLERLLARHPDAAVVEPVPGRQALVRRDQLLVAGPDAAAVEDRVRRWCDSRRDEHGVASLRLRPAAGVDVCELAAGLAGDARHRRLGAAPNHLVQAQPLWWSGPADLPRPAAPLPAPVPAGPPRREVTIAVLDSGLWPHPWYEHAAWYAPQRAEAMEDLDADLDFELDAQAGHGTFVAGVLLRRAPSARLRAYRVVGGDGVGDELDVIRALGRLADAGGADVVNLSIGCHTYDDRPSPVLARAVAAFGRGTAVVACAGNTATDRPFWPAALKPVIAVAALDGPDRAWFSNYGWWVDACAPGTGVTSSFVRFGAFEGYASWSGTSFAAPDVAGRIAALAAAGGEPAAAAADRLLARAARSLPDLGAVVGVTEERVASGRP